MAEKYTVKIRHHGLLPALVAQILKEHDCVTGFFPPT